MNDTLIYLDIGNVLILKYLDSVHPSEVNPRADHWKFIFQLYRDNKKIDSGLFKDSYFISEDKKMLILEEYDQLITHKSKIKLDDDVILNLRLFDFESGKTGKFSKVTGGRFLIKSISDKKVVFQKVYYDKTIEYETDLGDIDFEKIGY